MTMPTQGEARSRQTAYLATEAWWRSRVENRAVAWRQEAAYYAGRGEAHALAAAIFTACANELDALLAERPSR